MKALIIKEFRELRRDRRTLTMLIALPIVLLVIFGYAANFSVDRVSAIVVGPEAHSLTRDLAGYDTVSDDVEILRTDSSLDTADVEGLLRDQAADVVIVAIAGDSEDFLADRFRVYLDGSMLFTSQAAHATFMALMAEDLQLRLDELPGNIEDALAAGIAPDVSAPTLDTEALVTVLFNPDLKTSWVMVPGLIGLILLFIGVLITSTGLVRERETGTLEQLAVMPLRPSEIIIGKVAPYFLLALLDMAVVTMIGAWLFHVPFLGSIALFSLASVVFLLALLGVGVLISSVSHTIGQSLQLGVLFLVPQVLLSGLIFPLESMPIGVRWIGYIVPLTWFREAAQGVMLRGAGFDSLWLPFTILAAMAVLALGAATGRMRHSLTHGGVR